MSIELSEREDHILVTNKPVALEPLSASTEVEGRARKRRDPSMIFGPQPLVSRMVILLLV